jgi:hypothetical protein
MHLFKGVPGVSCSFLPRVVNNRHGDGALTSGFLHDRRWRAKDVVLGFIPTRVAPL